MTVHNERIKAHKANIDRYCRLLATQLTDLEREYLYNRLMEEHAILSRLEAEAGVRQDLKTAPPQAVIAAKSLSADRGGHSHR
jgi:uncharacterized protein (DUF849 family)